MKINVSKYEAGGTSDHAEWSRYDFHHRRRTFSGSGPKRAGPACMQPAVTSGRLQPSRDDPTSPPQTRESSESQLVFLGEQELVVESPFVQLLWLLTESVGGSLVPIGVPG